MSTSTTSTTRNHNSLRISSSSASSPRRSTTPTSSGAITPTHPPPTPSTGGGLSSYLWNGLLRRFSSDPSSPSSQSLKSPSSYHTQSMPIPRKSLHGSLSDEVYTPPNFQQQNRTPSPFLPQLEPLSLNGFSPRTPSTARLMTAAIAEEIRLMVPARLSLCDEWKLVYSLEQDGASLNTLYNNAEKYRGKRVGFVLCVRDSNGTIFGAYLSDLPHPAPNYFGTGECFLWKASTVGDGIRFKAFPYSGVNEYYILCESHFLSVGAGENGKFGLWLDDGLERGLSSMSQTFGNEPLSEEGEKFGVSGVELWVIGG
ncbi:putative oxidation resistance protein 1 [Podospora fimiseda]|uniref:Oxidation resistance protein 1 n=1 Tax=Podospora fimiseda TaxID=252190 RepID=A0AAN7BSA6_9PEZI|nr:putative oxidation resistance protein 1 [Podospora fimiseda]